MVVWSNCGPAACGDWWLVVVVTDGGFDLIRIEAGRRAAGDGRENETEDEMLGEKSPVRPVCSLWKVERGTDGNLRKGGILGPAVEFWVGSGCGRVHELPCVWTTVEEDGNVGGQSQWIMG